MSAEIATILLDSKAVTLRPSDPFTFTSGIKSPIYCDNRLLLSLPDARTRIVEALAREVQNIDVIAGVATASIPWAALIAEKLGKPMIYVRNKAKGHGKENQIEGTFEAGSRVIVIEDLISTGGSSLAAVEALRSAGANVDRVISIFTYNFKKAHDSFASAECSSASLTNFEELVDVAAEKEIIDTNAIDEVKKWNKDPEGWK